MPNNSVIGNARRLMSGNIMVFSITGRFHRCSPDTVSDCSGICHYSPRVHCADGRHYTTRDAGTGDGRIGTRRSHDWCRRRWNWWTWHRFSHYPALDDSISCRRLPLRSKPHLSLALCSYRCNTRDHLDRAFHP